LSSFSNSCSAVGTFDPVTLKNNQAPRGKLYVWLIVNSYFIIRAILWSFGFIWKKGSTMRINDVFSDYQPIQDVRIAPIVVSNHCSFVDMMFYLTKNVSFLSKKAVAHTPILGLHAIARQSIFLNRDDEKDRNKVLELIKERTRRVREKEDLSPLLIFPEGTITNGRVLMGFKKGAFFSGDPIKIYAVRYNTDSQLIASMININPIKQLLRTCCQLYNEFELMEFEDHFDPEWTYQKHGITKEDPRAWEYVAADVKALMAFITGFNTSEDTYRETLEFEKDSLEIKDPLIEIF
jgi:1-acyl-sn-glycerol-3-phosphate acyltransferase